MGCRASTAVVPSKLYAEKGPTGHDGVPKLFHRQYRLGPLLGKGAFAQVYDVKPACGGKEGEQELAVKVAGVRGQRSRTDLQALAFVEREVDILRTLASAPGIVSFREHFVEGAISYIVTEKCESSFLQALERTTELTESTLARLVRQMLQALAHIHERRIIHRDVKPDNFLWTGSGVKLCDFGLAELMPSADCELKGVYGTAPFLSPEMLTGSYGTGTDVWSLGVLAYVLLLGEFPNRPIDRTTKAMKMAIRVGKPGPSYCPALGNCPPCTGLAEAFLQAALVREKSLRIAARELMDHPWFTAPSSMHQRLPSLKSTLSAAKQEGAFDLKQRKLDSQAHAISNLMQQLQEVHHKAARESVDIPGFAMSSEKRTKSALDGSLSVVPTSSPASSATSSCATRAPWQASWPVLPVSSPCSSDASSCSTRAPGLARCRGGQSNTSTATGGSTRSSSSPRRTRTALGRKLVH